MRGNPLSACAGFCLLIALAVFAGACSHKEPSKIDRLLTAEELYELGKDHLKPHRVFVFFEAVETDNAIATFQQIIDNFPSSEYALQAELMIGEAYYDAGRYEEASVYYEDFIRAHPSHGSVPQAIYQSGMCKHKRVPIKDRDQTPTKEAAGFFELLINKFPNNPFAEKAEERLRECKGRLAEHDYAIAEFYMRQEDYHGALNRCSAILANYPGSGADASALLCVGVASYHLEEEERARDAFERLVEEYPSDPKAEQARGYLARLDTMPHGWDDSENYAEFDEGEVAGAFGSDY